MSEQSDRTPTADFDWLAERIDEADAGGFVHAGTTSDPDLRYLTGAHVPSRRLAFILVDGDATIITATDVVSEFEAFTGEVVPIEPPTDPASAAASLLADRVEETGTVLTPRHIPHDAALYVQQEGFGLTSTPAVEDERVTKRETELTRIESVAIAADEGMAHARSLLADAEAIDGDLHWRDYPLTRERLRREINTALAESDVDAAGNTRIRVGTELPTDSETLPAGETLVISVTPRGPAGYHATLTRTFVVAGDGGWERRAHVACEAARRVGFDEIEPAVPGIGVVEELVAELGSFGFAPAGNAGSGATRNIASGTGHGIGLAAHEAPLMRGSEELQHGMVLALGPAASDAESGRVALTDTVVVTEDGAEVLTDVSTSLVPSGD